MTFTEIVTEVAERLNLTSSTATTRIGRSVNQVYRKVSSTIGIQTIERTTATANTVVGNRSVTFGPTPVAVQKLLSVYDTAFSPPLVLGERTFDQIRNAPQSTSPATLYAIQLMGSKSVTIFLNITPTSIYALTADVMGNITTISGSTVPAFAEDFHDILVDGAMEIEYEKMEKHDLAKEKHATVWGADDNGGRVGELRLFIAASAYKDLVQGQTMGRVSWAPRV